jgi:hypothetical protein
MTMLILPDRWAQIHGGALAGLLLRQIRAARSRAAFARYMIAASLCLLEARTLKREGRLARVKPLPGMRWRWGSGVYAYYPDVDDNALDACARGRRNQRVHTAIVPDGYDQLFQSALEAFMPRHTPTVHSFCDYICWRTMWGGPDLDLSHEEVNRFVLRRYDRSVARHRELAPLRVFAPNNLLSRRRKTRSLALVRTRGCGGT